MADRDKPLVFLIDDSAICIELVTEALEEVGFTVESSTQPLGSNRRIVELRPDVVVLDISMPALDGATLVKIIQRNTVHECPVLLHTDRDRAELRHAIETSGADGGAVKSPDSTALITELRRVLRARGVRI